MQPIIKRILEWVLHISLGGLFCLSVSNLVLLLLVENKLNNSLSAAQRITVIVTTLSSGFIINVGTIIQTCATLMRKDVRLRYTECLLVGCLILFVSQVQLMLYAVYSEGHLTWDQIATPFTTFLSVVCTCAFHVSTKLRREEKKHHEKSYNLLSGETALQQPQENITLVRENRRATIALASTIASTRTPPPSPPPLRKVKSSGSVNTRIIFVEGTAGIGKSTICDESFDFSRYLTRASIYLHKQEVPYVQSLYEGHVYADIITEMCLASGNRLSNASSTKTRVRFNSDEVIYDRSPFAQIAYNIIFALNGEKKNPFEYRNDFDKLVQIPELHNELRHMFNKWVDIFKWINADVKLIWLGSQSPEQTAARLLARSGIREDCNLSNYIINQNYTFSKLCEISGVGTFYLTNSLERKFVQQILDAERSAARITDKVAPGSTAIAQ